MLRPPTNFSWLSSESTLSSFGGLDGPGPVEGPALPDRSATCAWSMIVDVVIRLYIKLLL